MNRRRYFIFGAMFLSAAMLLSACEGAASPAPSSSGSPESTVSSDPNASPEATKDDNANDTAAPEEDDESVIKDTSEYPDDLYGLNDEKIEVSDITTVHRFSDIGWDSAACVGLVYLAEPTGVNYNSVDDADIFDGESDFTGSPADSSAKYKRYKTGDTICGFTIKSAETSFLNEIREADAEKYPQQYFAGGKAELTGEMQLTGYLIILSDELYGVGGEGDIVFVPDNDSQVLPIMNYNRSSAEKGVYSDTLAYAMLVGDFAFKNEYGFLSCGNISSYPSSWFLGEQHNVPIKAKVTISGLKLSSTVNWLTRCDVELAAVEI